MPGRRGGAAILRLRLDLPEMMKLECGRYDGRKTIFAIGVTFEQTPPR